MYCITEFECLPSTNLYAKENADILDDNTVISARAQTAGRGRKERKWVSDAGGLYFSVILKNTSAGGAQNLTQAMSIALCKAIEKHGGKPDIKWPNDVLLNKKKVCGILGEAVIKENALCALVLGAGVNIAQTDLGSIDQPATSLYKEGLADINCGDFLDEILREFYALLPRVKANGFEGIKEEYVKRCPWIGRQVYVKEQNIEGTALGLARDGALIIKDASGLEHKIITGDMIWKKQA